MRDSDLDAAVALARTTVGAGESVPASSVPVRRMDRDSTYVLVQLGRPGHPGWVAAVDVERGEVMTWAANESGHSTVPTERPEHLASAHAELVWRPSRASRSVLYPLLRLSNDDGEWFVDLAGTVSPTLADGRA